MSSTRTFIGVDPGASGGIAVLDDKGLFAVKIPPTEKDISDLFREIWKKSGNRALACVEKVQGYTGQSRTTGTQMFKFGWNYGSLRMAILSAGMPLEDVLPRKWQQEAGIAPRKDNESRTTFKNRIKAKAQQLFPHVDNITLKTCDAILIAVFIRRARS